MATNRPPVVAVMGHIDHGKSTLLDYIRQSNTTEKEAGGITQHVSAYEVRHRKENGDEQKITFLDTPGHEAFTSIRARGASIADIAVLVVSAEDGVKPQTLEAYSRIKEGEVPFIVAITKVDKQSANVDFTKQSLAENEIYVEGYGGNVPVVPLSAKSGQGVPELLDMILLLSEVENFTGEEDENGSGYILESRLDPKKGVTAVGIIKNGTVRRGLFAATKTTLAPLRFILDEVGNNVEELSFSSPIQIIGWESIPTAGDEFKTFLKKDEAVEFSKSGVDRSATDNVNTGDTRTLPIIIKADAAGSLEALKYEIAKLGRERIVPKITLSGIGSITEKDVKAAIASPGTTIFCFNGKTDTQAAALADRNAIPILTYNIIYELTDKVKSLLEEQEPKIEVEETRGTAKILKFFSISKDKQVLGGRVLTGEINLGAMVKILRRDAEIGRGKIRELQQSKVKADTVLEGNEFGMLVESKIEIAPGDVLESIVLVTK